MFEEGQLYAPVTTGDGLMFVAAAALLHLTGALTAPAPATVPAPVAEPLPPRGTSPSADEPVPPAPTPA
jgi:hypothetical protein